MLHLRSPRWPVLFLAIAMSAGCSFFVQGPPADYRPDTDGAPACTRCANGILTLDAIGAIWGAGLAVGTRIAWSEGNEDMRGFTVVGAAGALVHVAALVYGWSRTSRCRDAQDRFIRWADIRPVRPPLPPVDCNELRRKADAESDPPRRFELMRQLRARCETTPTAPSHP